MPKKSTKARAERVVRYQRADGTVVEKRYAAYDPRRSARNSRRQADDTLGDLITAYERSPKWRGFNEATKRNKVACFAHLSGMWNVPVRDFTKRVLLEQRDAVAEARGDGAALNFAKMIQALFAFAEDREWIDVSPAKNLGKDLTYGEWPAWSETEYQQAIDWPEMPERLRRAFVLARWTAQRIGDLVRIGWQDITRDPNGDGWINLTQQKTGKKMRLPIVVALDAELQRWRAEATVVDRHGNPTGPLLLTDAAQAWQTTNLSAQASNHLEKIPGFNPRLNMHGLRKFALTDLANRGASLHTLQAFGGHDTLQMVQHYTKTADQIRGAQQVRTLLNG